MTPNLIKISQEFSSPTGGLWMGIEATVEPGENITEAFEKANKLLQDAVQQMHPTYGVVHQVRKVVEADPEFELMREKLLSMNYEDADAYLSASAWGKYNLELKNIVNSKKIEQ